MTNYSICIATYDYRFDKYLVPLIDSIKSFRPNIDIILVINGNYNEDFNEDYRSKILSYCASKSRIFTIFFPEFRGLSKLWNTGIIHSVTDNVLVLNDDISILNKAFFDDLEINLHHPIFKINGSWSHYFINRKMLNNIGWFDERFLGIGEEDGDIEYRYGVKYNNVFPSIEIANVINHVEYKGTCKNMRIVFGKYAAFNRQFMFGHKYCEDRVNGVTHGITAVPLVCKDPALNQYPVESFFWENKHLL